MPKRHKYNAQRVTIDGHTFASKAEGRRYGQLKQLGGQVANLELQPKYRLKCIGADGQEYTVGNYIADFAYDDMTTGKHVIEDVKGVKTSIYRWKKKHFEAQYGMTITEISA